MNKIKILLITIVFLSVASICQARAKDTLQAKLTKLDVAAKAKQVVLQNPKATVEKNTISKKMTLAERINKLETLQKDFSEAGERRDVRMSELEVKLAALEARSEQLYNDDLLNRIAELESKVQQLETPSQSAEANRPEAQKDSVSKVDSTVDSRNFAMITESESITRVSEVKSDALPSEPVIKASKLLTAGPYQLGLEVTADYFGKYIWRGQNLSDDPVFQPGVSMTIGGLTAGWWANVDTTKINGNNGEFTEHDWYVDYSGDLPGVDGVGYSVGTIYYYFPSLGNGTEDTTELYWGLSFDLPLSPSVTVYYDIDEVKGTYASFGIGHSIEKIAELAPDMPIGMDMGASLGWGSSSYNKGYWGSTVKSSKLNDLALSLSFPVEIAGWTVAPSLNYVTLVNGKIRETDTFNKASDYFFAGVSVSKSF